MKQFRIFTQNNMSELVKISEAIGKKGVNIRAIVTDGSAHGQVIKLVTNDIKTTQNALNSAGFNYELKEILSVELPDRPGELYKVTRRLAKARIMVESLYILGQSNGKTEVAMVVDNMDGARMALKI